MAQKMNWDNKLRKNVHENGSTINRNKQTQVFPPKRYFLQCLLLNLVHAHISTQVLKTL